MVRRPVRAATTPATTTPATTTPSSGSTSCAVTYQVASSWSTGFVTNVTIKNTGTAALGSWTLRFSFSGDQKITNLWNGVLTQSGTAVTIQNAAYNGTVAAGGSTSLGFQGTYSGSNVNPTTLTVNGTTCTTS